MRVVNLFCELVKKYKYIIVLVFLFLVLLGVCFYFHFFAPYQVKKDFSNLDLKGYDKVMIVAHPDDDILWGGAHLIEDNYLVVCVTCGAVKYRVNEFISVMHETNDRYVMLGYPDKTNGERDNWDSVRDSIRQDLEEILSLKDWKLIVTHNPQGEYGHIHHKMTSSLVTDVAIDKNKLYYFGRYHSKKKVPLYYDEMAPINDSVLKRKKQLIGLYKSQYFIQTAFDHMFGYEDWESYDEWESGK